MTSRPGPRDLVLVALCNLFWTPLNLIAQIAQDRGWAPTHLAATRWGLIALVLGGWCVVKRPAFPDRRGALLALAMGALFFGPAHALFYASLNFTSSVEGLVLGTSAPIWVGGLAWLFLREKVDRRRWIAILLGAAGAYVVSVGLALPALDQGHAKGNLMYLAAVLMECVAGVAVATAVRRSSGVSVLFLQSAGAAVALAFLSPRLGTVVWPSDPGAWLALGYMVVFAGLFNFAVWYGLVERLELSWLALTVLAQPPLGALLAWLVRGEVPTARLYAGTLLILAALVLSTRRRPPILVDRQGEYQPEP